MIVARADKFLLASTWDIPNCEPNYDAMRWWQSAYPNENAQLVILSDNPDRVGVEHWLRQFGLKHSYVLPLNPELSMGEQMAAVIGHAGSLHTKILLYISTSLAECNWMSSGGVPSVHFIPPRPVHERYEEDMRSSWEKQSAGIAELASIEAQ